jgi:hypothetical protein
MLREHWTVALHTLNYSLLKPLPTKIWFWPSIYGQERLMSPSSDLSSSENFRTADDVMKNEVPAWSSCTNNWCRRNLFQVAQSHRSSQQNIWSIFLSSLTPTYYASLSTSVSFSAICGIDGCWRYCNCAHFCPVIPCPRFERIDFWLRNRWP